ncbi:Spy/CpxP family protein refolding chaperone [Falsiroseomonas sp. E2-1-a20]|uniref:Spy/CpxP family protein refolding chaperone n=1 Tax=Falsiroseomonas sp. E2-1-a20 TaxID=3239300 RepID=UPI003F2D1870
MRRLIALACLFALPAAAQHAHHHPPAAQPYAGMQARAIKAISPEQAADLLAGRGMALALAAELNGYPGPMHVLEHAEALALTTDQRAEAARLRDAMAAEARALGARILAVEAELDALFAGGQAEAGPLAALTAALGGLTGRLREVHLAAHIGMRAALTPAQRATYASLRGYAPR